jgi:hypothetical protein
VVCVFKYSFILYSNWLFNSSIYDRRSSFSSLSFFVAIIKLINIRNIIEGALKAVTGQLDGQRLPSSTVRDCQARRSEIAKLDSQRLHRELLFYLFKPFHDSSQSIPLQYFLSIYLEQVVAELTRVIYGRNQQVECKWSHLALLTRVESFFVFEYVAGNCTAWKWPHSARWIPDTDERVFICQLHVYIYYMYKTFSTATACTVNR